MGYVYQATNWYYTGMTKPRTDKYSPSGHARHYVQGEQRRQIRTAKHRYVFLVGNKAEKKQMLKELNYPIIREYPKGDSRHYNTENPQGIIQNRLINNPLFARRWRYRKIYEKVG